MNRDRNLVRNEYLESQKERMAQTVEHNHLMTTLKADQMELKDMFETFKTQVPLPDTTLSRPINDTHDSISFPSGTHVTYKTHLFENTGIIHKYDPVKKTHIMYTKDGTLLQDLFPYNITVNDTPPSFQAPQSQQREDNSSVISYSDHDKQYNYNNHSHNNPHRQHHDYEFEHPPGTGIKTITSHRFISSMKECVNEFKTTTINDLDILYDNMYNRLRAHNMLLHPYHDINPVDDVEILNYTNYVNFENSRRIISENIYLFFNTYKTTIFSELLSLQAELI